MVSFLAAGFWYPNWRVADMDFWIVYNSFLLNAHLPQEYFGHPGYLTILSLAEWLRALHALGLVKITSLSALPPVSHLAAFSEAWTVATRAGRVLSLIYAISYVLAFAYLLGALVHDWRIAVLDPLAIVTAALLIAKLTDLQPHHWAYPIGMVPIGAHLIISQAEPEKHAFKTGGPDMLCALYQNAKWFEHLPVCKVH